MPDILSQFHLHKVPLKYSRPLVSSSSGRCSNPPLITASQSFLLEKQPSRRTSLRNSRTTAAPPGQQLHRDLLSALQHSLKQSEKGKGGAAGCEVLACLVDRAEAAAAKQIVVREASLRWRPPARIGLRLHWPARHDAPVPSSAFPADRAHKSFTFDLERKMGIPGGERGRWEGRGRCRPRSGK